MQHIVSIFEYFAKTNAINFAIMAFILYYILKKINFSSILNKSVEEVEHSIQKSEEDKKEALVLIDKAKYTLSNLPKDIKQIEDFTKQKSEVFQKQLEISTTKKIESINQNVDKVIAIEEKKISQEITGQTIINSVEKSKQDIIEKLKNNPDLHNKFIEESLNELDRTVL